MNMNSQKIHPNSFQQQQQQHLNSSQDRTNSSTPNNNSNISQVLIIKKLYPLLNLGYYCGFFPFQIKNHSSFSYYKFCHIFVFIATFIGVADFLFHCFSIFHSIVHEQRGVIDIITQIVWITSGIVSICINLKALLYHEHINTFLQCWKKLEPNIIQLVSDCKVSRCCLICYIVYAVLALLSITFCVFHSVRLPAFPTYFLHFIKHDNGDLGGSFPLWLIILNSIGQALRVTWVWIGTAMLECFSTIVATFITLALQGIIIELEYFYKQPHDTTSAGSTSQIKHDENEISLQIDLACHSKAHEDNYRTLNKNETLLHLQPHPPSSSDIYKNEEVGQSCDWTSCPLLGCIRHYQILNELQTLVNNFIGFLIFIDFAQLIILISSLTFLPIKYIDKFDLDNTIVYCGNGACMTLRLIILIICIGNVVPAAQATNVEFGKVITSRHFPNQVLNPVLGHLSIYSASPIGFSAWGFFAITKGTLLTSLSLIITYLIVFLQINVS